eukprot:377982-Alexandrium_andersonii.AAC.1
MPPRPANGRVRARTMRWPIAERGCAIEPLIRNACLRAGPDHQRLTTRTASSRFDPARQGST